MSFYEAAVNRYVEDKEAIRFDGKRRKYSGQNEGEWGLTNCLACSAQQYYKCVHLA